MGVASLVTGLKNEQMDGIRRAKSWFKVGSISWAWSKMAMAVYFMRP